jgi:uncharacterized protein YdiU (UPF0061 family)
MNFSNSYADLGDAFYQRVLPTPVSQPELLLWNSRLAESLQLADTLQNDPALQAQYFSGNQLPEGADSIALAYSGHQFGQLNPQLGDGRAHLLGEVLDRQQQRYDIQLKGSGPTPYSRQGDGRCALGPALREYIMSEAMYFLGVPTSQCLAVVATGDSVYRESVKPGAVVTRVAASHIRVGTFQYFAIRDDIASLTALVDYTIKRHYPEIENPEIESPEIDKQASKALGLLKAVIEKQITLIVEWMRVGFIHGVMNTDNSAISGETIDFGPCAMMGTYNPDTVYSSIDTQGRYAFGNQPSIGLWNMTRFAECLLPLIASEQEQAVAIAEPMLMRFGEQFEQAYFKMLANKVGLADVDSSERPLLSELLTAMQEQQLDYNQTFLQLTQSLDDETVATELKPKLGSWYDSWRTQLGNAEQDIDAAKALMKSKTPVVIARNHHVEKVLAACEASGNAEAAEEFLRVLRSPYEEIENTGCYQDLPVDDDKDYHTFCGT